MIRNTIAILFLLLFSNCNQNSSGAQKVADDAAKVETQEDTATGEQQTTIDQEKKPEQRNPTFVLVLVGEGIQAVNAQNGSASIVAFDTEKQQAVTMVANVLQSTYKDSVVNADCGGLTILSWANGLSLNFATSLSKQKKGLRFVGWSLHTEKNVKSTLATMAGVGIGSTLKEIETAYEIKKSATTLGTEVSLGKITALLSKDAADGRVVHMWSGTNCIFR